MQLLPHHHRQRAMVGAGAVVVEAVPAYAVVAGTIPRAIVSSATADPQRTNRVRPDRRARVRAECVECSSSARRGQDRGQSWRASSGVPAFKVKRFSSCTECREQVRGQHAHRMHQFLT